MELTLSLDALKFANVSNFTRTYGTKKTSSENGGSLTTNEFNINQALPWDLERPIVITESSTVSGIEYDAKLLVNAASCTVTLGTGTDGITLTVASLYATTVTDGTVAYSVNAGETIKFMYFNSAWNRLNPSEYFGSVSDASTQTINVTCSNYTGTVLPVGARILVAFSDDYAYDGQPSFTVNGGSTSYPVTVGGVAAGIGAFQGDETTAKTYEFIFNGASYDCLSSPDLELDYSNSISIYSGTVVTSPTYTCTKNGEIIYNLTGWNGVSAYIKINGYQLAWCNANAQVLNVINGQFKVKIGDVITYQNAIVDGDYVKSFINLVPYK